MKYNDVKHESHVFIYGVNGRSSSTALQRILNSSGEVCIWGEAWGIDQPFLSFIEQIENKKIDFDKRLPKEHFDFMVDSFKTGNHDTFYPNAFNDLSKSLELIKDAFVQMIKPVTNIKRLGYKEIRVQNASNLSTLINLFPNCKVIFLFRDPRKQWISVRDSGWFGFSNDLDKFNSEYNRISNVYLDVLNSHPDNCIFLENTSLYNESNLNKLFAWLNLSNFDKKLINKVVSSKAKNGLEKDEEQKIINSSFATYQNIQELIAF